MCGGRRFEQLQLQDTPPELSTLELMYFVIFFHFWVCLDFVLFCSLRLAFVFLVRSMLSVLFDCISLSAVSRGVEEEMSRLTRRAFRGSAVCVISPSINQSINLGSLSVSSDAVAPVVLPGLVNAQRTHWAENATE